MKPDLFSLVKSLRTNITSEVLRNASMRPAMSSPVAGILEDFVTLIARISGSISVHPDDMKVETVYRLEGLTGTHEALMKLNVSVR